MTLRLRLGLLHGVPAGLAILLVSLVTYAVHTRIHYDDLDRVLAETVAHVASERAALPPGLQAPPLLSSVGSNIVVRRYDSAGRLAETSAGAGPLPSLDPRALLAGPAEPPYGPLAGVAPSFVAVGGEPGAFGLLPGASGERWRVYVLPLDGQAGYLAAATSLAGIDASVVWLRRLMAIFSAASTVILIVTCWLLVVRALRPVDVMTHTARDIAHSRSFSRRVPLNGQRDELGQLATTLNEMLANLERAYQSQQRFVADASHELRAPLTAIQANLELLERRPAMPPVEQREALGEASREARRLARLVNDLLALARADTGVTLRRRPVDLDRVALDALGEARHLARGQRLAIGPLEPIEIEGDPDRLQQLLLILLDNALKYTPSDGQVTLGLRRDGTTAEVTVLDTGIGIGPGDLPLVFERFYRADPGRARDPGGTGLGLPIARWIAEQHGGEIALESAPGRGTTAVVRLPLPG